VAAPAPVAEPAVAAASPAPVQIVLEDGLAHFGFDRAELSERGRAELDAWLKQPPPKGRSLRVTGHADRLGPASYNLKLSGRRAETVKNYLMTKGVDGNDIQVVAKGESEPVKHCKGGATKATIACLAPNRRVEIDP
jgi:OOP family OmpA-OmpF porin